MNLSRITNSTDHRLESLIKLYEESFPEDERRTIAQLNKMIDSVQPMYFNAIEIDGQLCGLFVYWDMDDFYYMEHLAVFPEMRNRKIGQQVLDHVARHLNKIRILEVEPTEDEITTRRVQYYQRNGYAIVHRDYIQPSYKAFEDASNLWIMSNEPTVRLNEFIDAIKQRAYRDHIPSVTE